MLPPDIPAVRGGTGTCARAGICRGHVAHTTELPHHVYYTAKRDPILKHLTEGDMEWPADYRFFYYDNPALEESVVQLSRLLADAGVPDFYRAYLALRPWAFRADLWR